MSKRLTVIKCDAQGEEVFRWEGLKLSRTATEVLLEARFNIQEHRLGAITLREGDRMLETYSSERWFNTFEVYDGANGALKCWYCNLSYPAELGERQIIFRDLALDLIVHPDGRQEELDAEEFAALGLTPEDKKKALAEWQALKDRFKISERGY